MTINRDFSKIHISLYRERAKETLAALGRIGVTGIHVEAGRSIQLGQASGLARLMSSTQPISEESVSVFTFLVPRELERDAIAWLVGELGLDHPGRGSVWATQVNMLATHAAWVEAKLSIPTSSARLIASDLTGLACIVQKGEANEIARIGLSTGTAIPVITYGIGTGLRNRLGLWRILVPAEKEVATLVMHASEAEAVMNRMIDEGQLDQPGKGFIYVYPVASGVLDTKFHVGAESQAASVEQIVSTLDEIRGSTEWRRKSFAPTQGSAKKRKFLNNLVNFSITCNEGQVEHFTQVAMTAGASGATFRRLRYLSPGEEKSAISPAREVSILTIGPDKVGPIAAALEKEGLHEAESSGEILISPVAKACTFLGK
jgi:nitrogen regulatory protein PII